MIRRRQEAAQAVRGAARRRLPVGRPFQAVPSERETHEWQGEVDREVSLRSGTGRNARPTGIVFLTARLSGQSRVVPPRVILGWALTLVLFMAGCSQSPPEPATSPAPAPAPSSPSSVAEQPAQRTSNPAVVAPTAEATHLTEAREAFRVLTTAGSDAEKWDAAQQKLLDLGADAVPVLIEGLASTNPIEREMAATVFALTGAADPRSHEPLVKCLADESPFVRANAAAALAPVPEYNARVMNVLSDLLADTDPQLRRMAAANLGSFGAESSVELPKLTALLADEDAEVVTPVVQLLGRIGPPAKEAVPELQRIAFEQVGELQAAAQQALELIQTDAEKTTP